ncbi:MAG TPA: alpha/beta fold hydrolase [Chloroflexi bacterium]|nr:alpha/beta fold hydrolase [Chloroflexota bacterium]
MTTKRIPTGTQTAAPHRRRSKTFRIWFRRSLIALVGVVVLAILAGVTYERVMASEDATRYPAPGQLVDVGGHRLHLHCMGEGSPTVILEAGWGSFSSDWSLVQPLMASQTRVCAYDRAGSGWSDVGPLPRTPERIATELHTLLHNAGESGPFVLVGHSLGGRYVRMYAALHPDEVAGLVLVDARHEVHDQAMTAAQQTQLEAQLSGYDWVGELLKHIGVTRLFGTALYSTMIPELKRLPAETTQTMIVMGLRQTPEMAAVSRSEMAVRTANDAQLAAATLGDLPVHVLVASHSVQRDAAWLSGQEAQAALSQDSSLTIVEGGHYLHLDAPEEVARHIAAVIAAGHPRSDASAEATEQSASATGEIDAFIERLLAEYDVAGASIGVVRDGEVLLLRGYGVRNVQTQQPVTADTQFGIASVTKSFTALGVMLLVQEGKIDLNAPVTRYLPEFSLATPEATAKLTVRHLLTHASGMERVDVGLAGASITRDELVKMAASAPLFAEPGEAYKYSNLNTVIAAHIIEVVTGQSWEAFMQTRIFQPLGMTDSSTDIETLQQHDNFALPHDVDLLDGIQPATFLNPGVEAPAGGVNASAAEMVNYLKFQLTGDTPDGEQLLTPDLLNAMHMRYVDVPAPNVPTQGLLAAESMGVPAPPTLTRDFGYGFYWFVEDFLGHEIIQHDGQGVGYSASVSLAPTEGVGVVVLTNGNGAHAFVESVRQHLLAWALAIDPMPDAQAVVEAQMAIIGMDNATRRARLEQVRTYRAEPDALAAFAGEYTHLMGATSPVMVVAGTRTLSLAIELQGMALNLELAPIAPDKFLINTDPLRGLEVSFDRSDNGDATIVLAGMPVATRSR